MGKVDEVDEVGEVGEVHEVDVVVGVVTKDAAAHGFTEEGEEGEETTNVAEAIIKLTAQQSPCAGCVASATEPCYVLACRLSIWRTEWRSSETSNFAGAVAFRFTDVKEQHRRVHRSQMGLFRRKLCPKKIREDKQGHKNNNKCFLYKISNVFFKMGAVGVTKAVAAPATHPRYRGPELPHQSFMERICVRALSAPSTLTIAY